MKNDIKCCPKTPTTKPRIVGHIYAPNSITAYDLAKKHGFKGTEEEWIKSLQGKSAYELAVKNGFHGTEEEWLSTLGEVVDHNSLYNRDKPDSHPISAITNLDTSLDLKQDQMTPLTVQEILDICS